MVQIAEPDVRARWSRPYTARERIERLCDPGTFTELAPLVRSRSAERPVAGDGVVTGFGAIGEKQVVVIAHEFSYAGGSIGAAFAAKVVRAQQMAIARRRPIVYLNDSGGARIQEGIEALNGCGEIMALNVAARAVVPQISVILGPCAGAAAYSPALTDWVVMARGSSQMFLTGPEVVRAATGESVDPEDLGGADVHGGESGVAHLVAPDEAGALAAARRLLSYLPSARGSALPVRFAAPPPIARAEALPHVVPVEGRRPYDMRAVLAGIVDGGVVYEVMHGVGQSLITGFARMGGSPVGIVASQPRKRGGILDARAAVKGARFVSFCGRFGIPIVTFVDVPGFLPGSAEERRGVITHGAQLLAAYVDAHVPKLTVIVRKAYGGAYIALGSRALGAEISWAWPSAEIAVMGPEAATGLLHRRTLAAATDPETLKRALTDAYRAEVADPSIAAGLGIVDDIIPPEQTRARLLAALTFLSDQPVLM